MLARSKQLALIGNLLRTPDGQALMNELREAYSEGSLLGETPEKTAYRVGQFDVYRDLLRIQEKVTHE